MAVLVLTGVARTTPVSSLRPELASSAGSGYALVGADGSVYSFDAAPYGSLAGIHLTQPVVGAAATPDGRGYLMAARDGGVFAFGDARFQGSMGGRPLAQPIVGMAIDPATGGYWMVAADGGIFSFGAPFYGSTGAIKLAQPIVGMASTPDGRGYWLVARDGGVFAFGDARFRGSMGGVHLVQPVVGMTADSATGGYWLVASDGGLFSFGAPFLGSMGGRALAKPVIGMASTGDGGGYDLLASDGGIFAYGDGPFAGSTGGRAIPAPIVAMATPLAAPVATPPPTPPGITITTTSVPGATAYEPYSVQLAATSVYQPPYAWQATGLPPGITLDESGLLSGTPTTPGTYTVTVTVTTPFSLSAVGHATYELTVVPRPTPTILTPTSLASAVTGQAYGPVTFTAAGGDQPYVWSATGLPAGLTLSPAGVLSGTTTALGPASVTVTVTDGLGQQATRTYPLQVVRYFAPVRANPPTLAAAQGISCPSVGHCMAVGNGGTFDAGVVGAAALVTDDGATWQQVTLPVGLSNLSSVSCPTVGRCTAVGSTLADMTEMIQTTDDGSTWTATQLPSAFDMNSVSCSTVVCLAVGSEYFPGGSVFGTDDVAGFSNAGGTWTEVSMPAVTGVLREVSCGTPSTCAALGTNSGAAVIITTTNGGTTWTQRSGGSDFAEPVDVSCSGATCIATGTLPDDGGPSVITSSDGGTTWAPATVAIDVKALPGQVSCSSAADCMITYGGPSAPSFPVVTTDGGQTWQEEAAPSVFTTTIGALACPDLVDCVASGNRFYVESGSDIWTVATTPMGVDGIGGVACSSPDACSVEEVGSSSQLTDTTDGGSTWSSEDQVGTDELGRSLDCPAPGTCLAIVDSSRSLQRTTDGGQTWSYTQGPEAGAFFTGLSCSSATQCVVVGSTTLPDGVAAPLALFTTDAGVTWSVGNLPSGIPVFSSVSCTGGGECMGVVGYAATDPRASGPSVVIVSLDGGATWTEEDGPVGYQPTDVVCVTVTTCWSAGVLPLQEHAPVEAEVTHDFGATWQAVAGPPLGSEPGQLSCWSATACGLIYTIYNTTQYAIATTTDGGASWQDQGLPPGVSEVTSLACPSVDCYAAVIGGPDDGTAVLKD